FLHRRPIPASCAAARPDRRHRRVGAGGDHAGVPAAPVRRARYPAPGGAGPQRRALDRLRHPARRRRAGRHGDGATHRAALAGADDSVMRIRRALVVALFGLILLAAWSAGLVIFVGYIPREPAVDTTPTDAIVVLTGG